MCFTSITSAFKYCVVIHIVNLFSKWIPNLFHILLQGHNAIKLTTCNCKFFETLSF